MIFLTTMWSYISAGLAYPFLFVSLYFEVFLLLTFVEKKKTVAAENDMPVLNFPSVTIIVPCFNEEKTVAKTLNSLLALEYPKEKLSIMVVDDGSRDGTMAAAQAFTANPQISVFSKENGGKYTALNFGIDKCQTELVGCLDADSFVKADALKEIVRYFDDSEVAAVTPSIKIYHPSGLIRLMQNVEYNLGNFMRKTLGYLGSIHITPGPFSIFRKTVFDKIGPYRHAHNTEDFELCLRIQTNHMKIANAHRAVVYTIGPPTIKKLYMQRVRWTTGFINNLYEYRNIMFNRDYGNLGMLILPMAFISVFGTLAFVLVSLGNFAVSMFNSYIQFQTIGLDWRFHSGWHFDWFFFNTQTMVTINLLLIVLTILVVYFGKRLAGVKDSKPYDLLCFIALYSFVSPFWILKSIYNAAISKEAPWR
jgi:cellulose synthase/poly-beta-1,6-N-acetylglucosamine synthase-like glycosyltransferase